MKIFEYQAKKLLSESGIPIPRGEVAGDADETKRAYQAISGNTVVAKAQVLVGGRGKAGGVKLLKSGREVEDFSLNLLGKPLTTHQGTETVDSILLEEAVEIKKELYYAILIDRDRSTAVLLASGQGGMDIEELAKTDPDAIARIPFDTTTPFPEKHIQTLCSTLAVSDNTEVEKLVSKTTDLFRSRDLELVEINPLVITTGDKLIALDAKMIVDDNALFRHSDLPELHSDSPVEEEAKAAGLSWVDLGGNIACLVNGAGLAMATADTIQFAGGKPANFLDIGGAADQQRSETAFRLLLKNPKIKAVLVNVFGGIVRCDLVAKALIETLNKFPDCPPVVVRLEGTEIKQARQILNKAKSSIISADTIDKAAELAVNAAKGGK